MKRLIINIIVSISIAAIITIGLIYYGKNESPDGYIILYNDAGRWTYASPTGSEHNQSLQDYANRKIAIGRAWQYYKWEKRRNARNNWHKYKGDKK